MAKTVSKTTQQAISRNSSISSKRSQRAKIPKNRLLRKFKIKYAAFRSEHPRPHRSFHRSYREDCLRPTETPGLLSHAMLTFQTIFHNFRTFGLFIILMVILYIVSAGLMGEEFYLQFQDAVDASSLEVAGTEIGNFAKAGLLLVSTIMTGGLDSGMGESQTIFVVLLFLIMWLVTIFLLRHFLAGEHPRLRDGLYNALTPLLSTLVVFAVIFVQAIPLMLVIITYSAASLTGFLATPFYALVYFIFAALMLLITGYLWSSSLMALVAVTTPGLYPLTALFATADLMQGRRTRLVIRLLYLLFVIAIIYLIVMLPIILLDLWLKSAFTWLAGVPIVPFCLLVTTCFVFIYLATYLYLYYRWLIDQK